MRNGGSSTKTAVVFDNPTIYVPAGVTTPLKSPIRCTSQSKFLYLSARHVFRTLLKSCDASDFYVFPSLGLSSFCYVSAFSVFTTLRIAASSSTFTSSSPSQLSAFYGNSTTSSTGLGRWGRLFTAVCSVSQAACAKIETAPKIYEVPFVGESSCFV